MTPQQYKLEQNIPVIRSIIDAAEKKIMHLTGIEVYLMFKATYNGRDIDEKEEIIKECCNVWGVDEWYVKINKRDMDRVAMRQILILLLRVKYTKLSLKDIATIFNMKDHTSIIYSIKTAQNHLQSNDELFMKYYNQIENFFYEN